MDTKILYFWDAYCGWTYGFGSIFRTFEGNNPGLQVQAISGGLFHGDNTPSLAELSFVRAANAQIEEFYDMRFGEAFNARLGDPSAVLNSAHPAQAFAILREHVDPSRIVELCDEIQRQFFLHARLLDSVEAYQPVIEHFGLSDPAILPALDAALREVQPGNSGSLADADFAVARAVGATSYPTVVVQRGEELYDLRGHARTADELQQRYDAICALGS